MTDQPDVLCIGDIDVDLMIGVAALPGFDQKVEGRLIARTPGGMAANVAVALTRLGASARLVGRVGDDADGALALGALRREGVEVSRVRRLVGTATFSCIVFLGPGGEKALVRLPTDAFLPEPGELRAADFAGVRHVYLTYGRHDLAAAAVAQARAAGVPSSLDLEEADLSAGDGPVAALIEAVDLLFVNLRTHRALAARGLLAARGPRPVIVTLGAGGSRHEADGRQIEQPALAVEPVDTTGAGDAFAAAFIHRHALAGAGIAEALAFANAAAALSTRGCGAQAALPRRHEVEAVMRVAGRPQ